MDQSEPKLYEYVKAHVCGEAARLLPQVQLKWLEHESEPGAIQFSRLYNWPDVAFTGSPSNDAKIVAAKWITEIKQHKDALLQDGFPDAPVYVWLHLDRVDTNQAPTFQLYRGVNFDDCPMPDQLTSIRFV